MIPATIKPSTDPKPRRSNKITHIAVAPSINTKLMRIDDSSISRMANIFWGSLNGCADNDNRAFSDIE
jgi:hypothetical protein